MCIRDSCQIASHRRHHLCRRKIPEPVFGEIFPCSRVLDSAGFVGTVERNARPLPFAPNPLLYRQLLARGCLEEDPLGVARAHFGDNRNSPYSLRVDVSRNMGKPLVPHVQFLIVPTGLIEKRMNRRPSEFGAPEPQGSARFGRLRPRRNMVVVGFR